MNLCLPKQELGKEEKNTKVLNSLLIPKLLLGKEEKNTKVLNSLLIPKLRLGNEFVKFLSCPEGTKHHSYIPVSLT
jgi:hypothetical protein